MLSVISVPHNGTHFCQDHLFKHLKLYTSHSFPAKFGPVEWWVNGARKADLVVVPLRDPEMVVQSWVNRGTVIADLRLYVDELEDHVRELSPVLLPIDLPGKREEQLAIINEKLGTDLTTDWPIIRQKNAPTIEVPLREVHHGVIKLLRRRWPYSEHYV